MVVSSPRQKVQLLLLLLVPRALFGYVPSLLTSRIPRANTGTAVFTPRRRSLASSGSGNNGESPELLVNFENDTQSDEKLLVNFEDESTAENNNGVISELTIEDMQVDGVEYGATYNLNGYTDSSVYHRSLKPDEGNFFLGRSEAYNLEELNEDGYSDMFRKKKKRSLVDKAMRLPFKLLRRISNGAKVKEPGTLILVRHGESTWNFNKTFTGWADPDLSENGVREVEHAARLLLEGGWEIDVVFTSRLKRAIRSTWIILQELGEVYLPVFKSWRLNERMYGALTGFSKTETAAKLGSELVQEWRGSLRTRPPALDTTSQYWPGRDRKYADLTTEQIPRTEALMDCMDRTQPVWEDRIKYELRQGRNVLVVAHANTLRGLVKIIDDIGDDEIQGKRS